MRHSGLLAHKSKVANAVKPGKRLAYKYPTGKLLYSANASFFCQQKRGVLVLNKNR